jgi:hypothetical protein
MLKSLGSSSKSVDTSNGGDTFQPQDIFQSGGYGLPPFHGVMDLDASQTGSDAMFMNDFTLNDLEMGQFFLPDDFLNRAHPSKNRKIP